MTDIKLSFIQSKITGKKLKSMTDLVSLIAIFGYGNFLVVLFYKIKKKKPPCCLEKNDSKWIPCAVALLFTHDDDDAISVRWWVTSWEKTSIVATNKKEKCLRSQFIGCFYFFVFFISNILKFIGVS